MFSKACEYALRALIFIVAKTQDGSRVGIKDIAKEIHSPEHFTAKILQILSRKGIVSSVKGPNGGFYIDPNSRKISLLEVVEAIDGTRLLTACALGVKECSDLKPCPVHEQYSGIRRDLIKMLKYNTIQSLTTDILAGVAFLKND